MTCVWISVCICLLGAKGEGHWAPSISHDTNASRQEQGYHRRNLFLFSLEAKEKCLAVPVKVYFEDVILQMDAKLLGDEYNKCHPPKQVDFITAQLYEIDTGDHQVKCRRTPTRIPSSVDIGCRQGHLKPSCLPPNTTGDVLCGVAH